MLRYVRANLGHIIYDAFRGVLLLYINIINVFCRLKLASCEKPPVSQNYIVISSF